MNGSAHALRLAGEQGRSLCPSSLVVLEPVGTNGSSCMFLSRQLPNSMVGGLVSSLNANAPGDLVIQTTRYQKASVDEDRTGADAVVVARVPLNDMPPQLWVVEVVKGVVAALRAAMMMHASVTVAIPYPTVLVRYSNQHVTPAAVAAEIVEAVLAVVQERARVLDAVVFCDEPSAPVYAAVVEKALPEAF